MCNERVPRNKVTLKEISSRPSTRLRASIDRPASRFFWEEISRKYRKAKGR